MVLSISLLGTFLLLSAFFSGTETAYTSLSVIQIQEIKRKRPKRGKLVESLAEKPEELLTTVLIGNNLMNIAATTLATNLTINAFGDQFLGVMTGVLTLFVLIFGEVTPKQLAITYNTAICTVTAPIIRTLSILFKPFTLFIGLVSNTITRLFGGAKQQTLTADGILHLVKHAENTGIVERFKSRMVRNVFRFSEVPVHAVMTHRTKVFRLDKNESAKEALPKILEEGFSRVPIYESEEDTEHIVGFVLVKDVIEQVVADHGDRPLKEIMRDPLFVTEHKRVHEMFAQFRKEGFNMAIVLDEYGGVSGVITMEDVVEEILGEIYDENETREREKITHHGKGSYSVAADIPIYVFNDYFGTEIPQTRSAATLGGFIAQEAGRIPAKGEHIQTSFGAFRIEQISRKHIMNIGYSHRSQDVQKAE